jgi:hypothetical protein
MGCDESDLDCRQAQLINADREGIRRNPIARKPCIGTTTWPGRLSAFQGYVRTQLFRS